MTALTKQELKRQVKAFLKDPDRGISHALFAEVCGIHSVTLLDVFLYETVPLSENVQIRVNRAYDAWKRGEVRVMQNKDRSKIGRAHV